MGITWKDVGTGGLSSVLNNAYGQGAGDRLADPVGMFSPASQVNLTSEQRAFMDQINQNAQTLGNRSPTDERSYNALDTTAQNVSNAATQQAAAFGTRPVLWADRVDTGGTDRTASGYNAATVARNQTNVGTTPNVTAERTQNPAAVQNTSIANQGYRAPSVNAFQSVGQQNLGSANTYNPQSAVSTERVGTPDRAYFSADAGQVQRAAAQTSTVNNASAAQIQTAQQNELRSSQQRLIDQLQAQSEGRTPSLDAELAREQRDKNIAAIASQAVSARGKVNAGLLARQQGNLTADANLQASRDAIIANLTARNAAQQQLGQAVSTARQQDIGLAESQAKLLQEQALQTQQLQAQSSQANASLGTNVNLTNAQAANQMALEQAKLQQQASQFGSGQTLQAGLANQAAQNQMSLAQFQAANEAQRYGAEAQNNFALQQAQLNQNASLANQSAYQQSQIEQARLAAAADQFGAQSFNQAQLQAAQLNSAQNLQQYMTQADLAKFNAAQQLSSQQINQDAWLKAQLQNTSINSQMAIEQARLQQQASQYGAEATNAQTMANQQALLQARQQEMEQNQWGTQFAYNQLVQNAQLQSALNQQALNASLTNAGFRQGLVDQRNSDLLAQNQIYASMYGAGNQAAMANAELAQKKDAGVLGAAGAALGAIFSDKNVKKDIKEGDKEINNFLNDLNSYEYKYKSEKYGSPGKQFGVMAQDLQRNAVGRTIVQETDEGLMLNPSKGFGPVLASLALLNRKNMELESKINKLKAKK